MAGLSQLQRSCSARCLLLQGVNKIVINRAHFTRAVHFTVILYGTEADLMIFECEGDGLRSMNLSRNLTVYIILGGCGRHVGLHAALIINTASSLMRRRHTLCAFSGHSTLGSPIRFRLRNCGFLSDRGLMPNFVRGALAIGRGNVLALNWNLFTTTFVTDSIRVKLNNRSEIKGQFYLLQSLWYFQLPLIRVRNSELAVQSIS